MSRGDATGWLHMSRGGSTCQRCTPGLPGRPLSNFHPPQPLLLLRVRLPVLRVLGLVVRRVLVQQELGLAWRLVQLTVRVMLAAVAEASFLHHSAARAAVRGAQCSAISSASSSARSTPQSTPRFEPASTVRRRWVPPDRPSCCTLAPLSARGQLA